MSRKSNHDKNIEIMADSIRRGREKLAEGQHPGFYIGSREGVRWVGSSLPLPETVIEPVPEPIPTPTPIDPELGPGQ
jgi:hypothetical protein